VAATPEPDPFADSFTAAISSRALTTAVVLGLFEALAESVRTAPELAELLSLDALGTETLCTALVSLGYLGRGQDGVLRNAPVSDRLLVRSSPESIATFVGAQGDLHWEVLSLLPEAVRSGRAYAMHEERRDPERWEAYMRGLFEISRPEHDSNAAVVPVRQPARLVDVAGGHGGFAMAMCRRHPALRATVLDLPPAVAVGRRIVEEQGFAGRVEFREGDVFEVGLDEDLDIVSAFNLIHHLPEERCRELCAMARAALKAGGSLAIGDTERPDPSAPVPQAGAVSSVLFYAWSHGHNFTSEEIAGWLEGAGFAGVEVHRNERSPWRIVVTGRA
jgi:2-polyprenyl-3-methyl-5-hydroxy-6-metoxy-1,4-benzoquinol methylase